MIEERPYGLIADLHAHCWSAFSGLDAEGRNTRLMDIVRELERCAHETRKAGGNHMVIAGDIFHVRGSVEPDVFNPVADAFDRISKLVRVVGIPGNHDLKGKHSQELGSSVAMLRGENVTFEHKPATVWESGAVLIPWFPTVAETLAAIEGWPLSDRAQRDLILHRGIDGTLTHMPATGFTAAKLGALGFKRVFAGDYHNHRDLGHGVWSIGAAAHQTWGDVGAKAGFMIVYPDRVQWHCSHAPHFIDLDGSEDPDELPLIVDGHFVRAKIGEAAPADILRWQTDLKRMGAKGVLIQATPKTAGEKREGVAAKSLATLDKSVLDYVSERGLPAEVGTACADILKEIAA